MAATHLKRRPLHTQSITTWDEPFQHALVTVVPATLIMILVTWSGILDSATVELGLEHYAEKKPPWLPGYIPMPLNTVINLGYVMCGLYWILIARKAHLNETVKDCDTFIFFVFNIMAFIYGFIQLYRVVFQTRCSAIMDQWYTLPFFMMVYVWAQSARGNCPWPTFYTLMCVSVLSYSLTMVTPAGFELALGCHILLAVAAGSLLYKHNATAFPFQYYVLSILSCSGFVILKLLDHHLPHAHWIFSYMSGHFLSKICDVFQVHYVNHFFFSFVKNAADLVRKGKKKA